ncbi:MAG: ABC transporter permease, partial [Mangrovicoccus sp.]
MLKLFAAHKGSRLIFAILTLSIALAGVVANYSLSHNAMRAFQSQLELKESAQFLISGRLADIPDASERAYDAGSFERRQVEIFDALLPPSVAVYRIRVRQSEILTETGPRPIKLVEASRDFLISQSAEPAPGLDWDKRTGLCAVGQSLTERLPETKAPELSLDGRICQVTAILSLKETPPFIGLSDAVFIPKGIAEMATDISLSWNVFLEDPSGALSEASLRTT